MSESETVVVEKESETLGSQHEIVEGASNLGQASGTKSPRGSASSNDTVGGRQDTPLGTPDTDALFEDLQNLEAALYSMMERNGGEGVGRMLRVPNLAGDDDDDDAFDFEELANAAGELPPALYPMGVLKYVECVVCCEKKDLNLRTCCSGAVCDACVLYYLDIQVEQGIVKIACPNNDCDQYVHRDEVMTRLTGEIKDKYYRFLTDANKDPHVKTCPRCSVITKIEPSKLREHHVKKHGLRHRCEDCALDWCFPCQAPWHEGFTCKAFYKGDKMVRKWAKEQHRGQVNAQKCPKCKIFIQRSSGCDHMTCNRCKVHFCYRCGERHIKVKFLGDHYSRLSIFGCKYKFMPEKPVRRKFIRGTIFALKTLLAPVALACVLAGCACCVGVAIFVLPFWGIHKLRKRAKEKKRRKEERHYREMWRQRLQEIRVTGDPYIANFNRMKDLGQNPYRNSGRNGPGNHGTLLVDELDMRHRNSTISSNASDTQSVPSLSEDHIRYIELNMGSLDIHNSNSGDPDLEVNSRGHQAALSSGLVLRAEDLLTEQKETKKKKTGSKIQEFRRTATNVEVHSNDRQKVAGSSTQTKELGQKELGQNEELAGVHNISSTRRSDTNEKEMQEESMNSQRKLKQRSILKCEDIPPISVQMTEENEDNKIQHGGGEVIAKDHVIDETSVIIKHGENETNIRKQGGHLTDEASLSSSDGSEVIQTSLSKSKKMSNKAETVGMTKANVTTTNANMNINHQKGTSKQGDSKVKRLVSQYSCSLRTNTDDEETDEDVEQNTDLPEDCSKVVVVLA